MITVEPSNLNSWASKNISRLVLFLILMSAECMRLLTSRWIQDEMLYQPLEQAKSCLDKELAKDLFPSGGV